MFHLRREASRRRSCPESRARRVVSRARELAAWRAACPGRRGVGSRGNEIAAGVDEALGAEASSCHETVNVGMVSLALVPGVEDGEDAGAQAARGRRLQDRLGNGGEERVECLAPAVSGEEEPERDGYGDDHVEVGERKQVEAGPRPTASGRGHRSGDNAGRGRSGRRSGVLRSDRRTRRVHPVGRCGRPGCERRPCPARDRGADDPRDRGGCPRSRAPAQRRARYALGALGLSLRLSRGLLTPASQVRARWV